MYTIVVMYGGNSCEHEISVISALQVMQALRQKYEVIPVYISKSLQYYSDDSFMDVDIYKNMDTVLQKKYLVHFVNVENHSYIKKRMKKKKIDFVFPILHGIHGEDGSVQGLLKMYNIPYAGNDVLSSALAQSKSKSKQFLQFLDIETLPYTIIQESNEVVSTFPCIIKPDTLGSSIGIQIVKNSGEYVEKANRALTFDEVCIVEPLLDNFKEINCSVMRVQGEICCSQIEEVNRNDAIYSFADKYEKSGKLHVAQKISHTLSDTQVEKIYEISKKIYENFRFLSVIRIDFIVCKNQVYVNEINSIPGSLAYYLWEYDSFLQYLEVLMQEGLKNYTKQQSRITHFESKVLLQFKGNKFKK